MQLRLVGYGAISGDGRGYRWIWQAPELPVALLNLCYMQLDCVRFSDPQQLRLLEHGSIEAGLLTVKGDWCAAYRFLHGGRDGSREKFFLVAAFFRRSDLLRLDLAGLLRHPLFKTACESCPLETTIELPGVAHSLGSLPGNRPATVGGQFSCPNATGQAVAACATLPANQSFHLHITGGVDNLTARLEPRDCEKCQDVPPASAVALPQASTAPIQNAKPSGNNRPPETWKLTGLCVGLVLAVGVGWGLYTRFVRGTAATDSPSQSASSPLRLISPLSLNRLTKPGPITRSQAMSLLKEKVKMNSKEADDYAFLVLPATPQAISNPAAPPALPAEGRRVRVETVHAYLEALKQGAAPFTTVDMTVDEVFQATAATLKFLSQAVDARRSMLPANLLAELPVSILGFNDSDQERALKQATAKGLTLRDYSRSGKLQKFRPTAASLQFESANKTYHLTELARGDFNGDGLEDSLVAVSWHYRGGTGLGCSMLLVQRVAGNPLTVQPFPLR